MSHNPKIYNPCHHEYSQVDRIEPFWLLKASILSVLCSNCSPTGGVWVSHKFAFPSSDEKISRYPEQMYADDLRRARSFLYQGNATFDKSPNMIKRVNIIQAQFLFRSLYVPYDSLLGYLLPQYTTCSRVSMTCPL